jgi:ABC-2 type transport system permease protein
MIGRTLGGATVAVMQGLIVFVITFFVGFRPASWALVPLAFVFMFLIAFLFTSLGTAIAARLDDMQGFQLIMNFLVMPMFFLSGALFPLTGLPSALEVITRIDPLTYGVDALRGTLANASHFGLGFDFLILGVLAAIVTLVGTKLFSKIEI